MKCEDFQILISAKLDAALDAEEASRLAAHLDECSSCHAYQQRLLETRRLLQYWEVGTPDFIPPARSELAATPFSRLIDLLVRGRISIPVPVAAAVVVAFATLLLVAYRGGGFAAEPAALQPTETAYVAVHSLEPRHDMIVLGGTWGGLEPEGGWKEDQ